MAIEILTKQDLNDFRTLLLDDIREIFQNKTEQTKQWLKSSEVRKLLNISPPAGKQIELKPLKSYDFKGFFFLSHIKLFIHS